MPIAFVFPASNLNPRKVDEAFADQYDALKVAGFPCVILRDGVVVGADIKGHRVVYRGWMLSPTEYTAMVNAIYAAGGQPFTSLGEYQLCHRLPNWYPHIEDLTMKTVFFPSDCDIEEELYNLKWHGCFIKDHVKSNKSALGSVARRPEDAIAIVEEIVKYRGSLEGGLCVREYMPVTNEHRIFVRDGRIYAIDETPTDYVTLAKKIASSRILAPFYSIDIGVNRRGEIVVIEIGDGQVSDLTSGWTPDQFAVIWSPVSITSCKAFSTPKDSAQVTPHKNETIPDGWYSLLQQDRGKKPTKAMHMLIDGRKVCNRWVKVTLNLTLQHQNTRQCEKCLKFLHPAQVRAKGQKK